MRKLSLLLAGTMILLAASAGVAQSPDLHHIYATTPVRVANIPQTPNNPSGTLPGLFRSAYGFNRIPNQGAGQTIALVDAFDDPNIASDLAFYANYFHYGPCHFQKVIVGSPLQGQGWDLVESLDVQQARARTGGKHCVVRSQ